MIESLVETNYYKYGKINLTSNNRRGKTLNFFTFISTYQSSNIITGHVPCAMSRDMVIIRRLHFNK